jgi:hypothetical protein
MSLFKLVLRHHKTTHATTVKHTMQPSGAFHLMARLISLSVLMVRSGSDENLAKMISVKIDPNFRIRLVRSPNVLCSIQQFDRSDRSRSVTVVPIEAFEKC